MNQSEFLQYLLAEIHELNMIILLGFILIFLAVVLYGLILAWSLKQR